MVLLNFVPEVLEMSSILHVMLLVFLRLFAILKPMSYKKVHAKLRYTSIFLIWLTSILFHAAIRTALILKNETIFYYGNLLIILCCNTLPVLLIFIMYIMLIWALRGDKSRTPDPNTVRPSTTLVAREDMEKKMTLAIQRIVLVLILCYCPWLVWRAYFYVVVDRRGFLLDEEVILIFQVQMPYNLTF